MIAGVRRNRPDTIADDVRSPDEERSTTSLSRRGRIAALVGSLLVALTMVFGNDLRLARGIVGDDGDGTWMLWLLDWVGHGITKGTGIFDAPIFYPTTGTYAFSDPLLTQAAAFLPLRAVTGSAAVASNLVVLIAFTASTYWAWRLLTRVSGNQLVAIVGALAWAYSAERMNRITLFQMTTAVAFVPLVLDRALALFELPTRRNGVWFGIASMAMLLAALYYVPLFAVVLVVLAVTWFAVMRERPSRDHVIAVAIAAVIVVIPFAPLAIKYDRVANAYDLHRPTEPLFALHLGDLAHVASLSDTVGNLGILDTSVINERALFPGFVVLAGVAMFIVLAVRRRRRPADREPDRNPPPRSPAVAGRWALVAAGAAAYLLAAGDKLSVLGADVNMPMHFLRSLPAFNGIRAPARYATVGQLGLCVLATCGLAWLVRTWTTRRTAVVVAVLALAVLVEGHGDVPHSHLPDNARWDAVNHALADRPAGAVVELPILSPVDGVAWPFIEGPRLYLSTIDHHPRVNGYSGYASPGFAELAHDLDSLPSPQGVDALTQNHVRYLVLRTSVAGYYDPPFDTALAGYRLTPDQAQLLIDGLPSGLVRSVAVDGDAYLVELNNS